MEEKESISENIPAEELESASGGNDLSAEEKRVGLTVRGQQTRTNARNRRGPRMTQGGIIKWNLENL